MGCRLSIASRTALAMSDERYPINLGNPLELTSKADQVFIDGKPVYTRKDGFLPWKGRPATLVP